MLKIILFHSSSKLSRLLFTQIILLIFGISCSGSLNGQPENSLLQPGTNSPGLQETSVESNTSPTPEFTQIATANMENSPTATIQAEVAPIPPTPVMQSIPESVIPTTIKPDYMLSASLAYLEHRLSVHEVISFTNTTGDALADLVFGVDAQKNEKGFALEQFSLTSNYTAEVRLENGFMFWTIEPAIEPGSLVTLTIDYQIKLLFGGEAIGYTKRQAYFGDWYPYLVYYEPGSGWIYHESSVVGEAQYLPLANFAVKVIVDQPDLIMAASQPFNSENGQFWFAAAGIRNVAWSVSPEYVILETNINTTTIKVYVFPEHRIAGEASLQTAKDAYQLFSEVYGKLNQENLSIVEVDFFDGMEYDGLFFLSQDYFAAYTGTPMGYLTMLSAHEVAHQWWYGNLANDQALEPWLDEALCTYSEKIFYQRYFPYLIDWWRLFRIERYEPEGWVDSTIYEFPNFRKYVDGVYLRGALYLEELSQEIGEDAFLNFLAEYNSQNSEQMVSSENFEQHLEHYLQKNKILELKEGFFKPLP